MKKPIRKIIIVFIIAIMAIVISSVFATLYYHDVVLVDYVISSDYSSAFDTYNKDITFETIDNFPKELESEENSFPCKGRIKNDKSKSATCYKYEYNGVNYLKVEITNNKLIEFGESDETVLYYIEN